MPAAVARLDQPQLQRQHLGDAVGRLPVEQGAGGGGGIVPGLGTAQRIDDANLLLGIQRLLTPWPRTEG